MDSDLSVGHFPAGWHYLLRRTPAQKDNRHHQGYLRNFGYFFKLWRIVVSRVCVQKEINSISLIEEPISTDACASVSLLISLKIDVYVVGTSDTLAPAWAQICGTSETLAPAW